MPPSIHAETSSSNVEREQDKCLTLRDDDLTLNETSVENKQMVNTETASSTLTIQHESDTSKIQNEEEFLTDSEDNNFEKRGTDFDIIVDETDISDNSDEDDKITSPKACFDEDADKTLVTQFNDNLPETHETGTHETCDEILPKGPLTSAHSLPLSDHSILDEVDVIESSDNMERFLKFSKQSNCLIPVQDEKKVELSELEEDADLFGSQEEPWPLENSTFGQKDEKIFTHKDSMETYLKEYYNISESDIIKILNFEFNLEEDFLGFDKNEFACNIKLCPTKREKDIKDYFTKCEKEIEYISKLTVIKQEDEILKTLIGNEDSNKTETNVQCSRKMDPLRVIVKNVEENKTRVFNNSSDICEGFLGFDPNEEVCNNPICAKRGKNVKKRLITKSSNDTVVKRHAKNFIFKAPKAKKPKVVVQKVFSLYE